MVYPRNVESKNLKKIYSLFTEQKTLTRGDIVSKTGLTYPTVGKMIDKLLDEELITWQGMTKSTGGRRAEKYKINNQRLLVVGMTLKLNRVGMSLSSLNGEVIRKKGYLIDYQGDLVVNLTKILKEFLSESDQLANKILGLSISFPGIVNKLQSKAVYSTILKVTNLQLKDWLEQEFSFPVWLENDVNLMAMGESYFSRINYQKGLLYIFWETGIGSAMMFAQDLVNNEFAGQLGHVVVQPQGELCFCGKRGCLETVLSPAILINQVKTRLASQVKSSLHRYDPVTLIDVLKEAEKGDSLGEVVLDKIENSLGLALANYIELFDPDLLILNGEIFHRVPFLVNRLKEYINSRIMFKGLRRLKIKSSQLGDQAELLGLLVLLKQKELANKLDSLFGYS
ncbi:MAG: ROK family protein [Halanaerobiales bacterium]|nr:ROK family protein [Halanaerobiales bacterium]